MRRAVQIILVSSVILSMFSLVRSDNNDDYLKEAEERCQKTRKTYTCAKYRALKLMSEYRTSDFNITQMGSVRFINIEPSNKGSVEDNGGKEFFGDSRQSPADGEWEKFAKFLGRQAGRLLGSQGIAVELPEGARVLQDDGVEGRAKKKKATSIVLPLLMLAKLFKIKVMVALILAGVMFIKKAILIAAFLMPSIIASIKAQCKNQQYHIVPYHSDDVHGHHEHDVTGTGYGYSGYEEGDTSHKHWDRSRKRYSSYGYSR